MKHFAKLSSDNIVLNVHAVSDDNAATEEQGISFLSEIHKWPYWKQTSISAAEDNLRLRPAMIGGSYDPVNDVFIHQQPYPSWTLDNDFEWVAPVARPDFVEGQPPYTWDEDSQSWIQ